MIARLLILCALCWPSLTAACEVERLATIPIERAGTLMLVPVRVNDGTGLFILDTGAALTVIAPDAVQRLGISLDEWTATTMRGVGGVERRRNGVPRTLQLGGVPLHRRSLAADRTLRVAALPDRAGGRAIDGLLGRDFLSAFDLDIDPAGGILTLWHVHACTGDFLPWTVAHEAIPVTATFDEASQVAVDLDGVRLRGLLDTGASQSLIAAPGMARLGLGLDRLADDPVRTSAGLGPDTLSVREHRFRTLTVGSVTLINQILAVSPIQIRPASDLLLGADWLAGRRVWLSYATHQVFIAVPDPH